MFSNRQSAKSAGNGQPNDADASNAEGRRVSFVDGTKFNEKVEKMKEPKSAPAVNLCTDDSGFGSTLSSFGNSDGGFGGFGSSFGSQKGSLPVRDQW